MVQQLTTTALTAHTRTEGVGGRHGSSPPPGRGGGYQDNCDVLKFRPGVKKTGDPRLDELVIMGLPAYWIEVAAFLGVDAFLGMWRILDANKDNIAPAKGSYSHSMSLTLRPYSNYLRFQKNRFVENLAAAGLSPKQIKARVQEQLCENISQAHISRLSNKHKIRR
jgi:hypothetical protein